MKVLDIGTGDGGVDDGGILSGLEIKFWILF